MTPPLPRRKRQRLRGRVKALAQQHHGQTGPNPSVGCVLLDAAGDVLAEGVTAKGGRPHAEEAALLGLEIQHRLPDLKGGIAVVSLEPCRERSAGTPACSQRLIAAGVGRVYILNADHRPLGKGGVHALRAAGIIVNLLT